MRTLLVAGAVLATFAAAAPAHAGGGNQVPTNIRIQTTFVTPEGRTNVFGDLASKPKCQQEREMQLIAQTGDDKTVIDTSTSSHRGGWGLVAKNGDEIGESLTVKVLKAKSPQGTCAAAKEQVLF